MKLAVKHAIWIALALSVMGCGGGGGGGEGRNDDVPPPPVVVPPPPVPPLAPYNQVGFFHPLSTPAELPGHMAFGMINAYNVDQVERSLIAAKGTPYKVKIDFSDLILERQDPATVGTTYTSSSGTQYTKDFPALPIQKLSRFPDDARLAEKIRPYILTMKAHEANVGSIFLADEPYLNGISKSEMERAGSLVRRELNNAGLSKVKLGVIFASGMFDQDFARHLDRAAGDYARHIDEYYERGLAIKAGTVVDQNFNIGDFDNWVATIRSSRLTTYDAAGNMYTGGGIPAGYEVVSFDYYLSTILLDALHVNSLSYLASRFPNGPCGQYAGKDMASIRNSLSYFHNGPINQGDVYLISDQKILDAVYQCRMTATFDLLRQSTKSTSAKIMMISESSANGSFEYYADGSIKTDQPKLLIEARVYNEVQRALDFYSERRQDIPCGLMFFLYNDAFDYSIDLKVFGASSLPSVLNQIFAFSAVQGVSAPGQCD